MNLMRVMWTVLSVIGAWISLNAFVIALRAAGNPPAALTSEQQSDYVNVAWIGFIAIVLVTIIFIILAVRSFKKAAQK